MQLPDEDLVENVAPTEDESVEVTTDEPTELDEEVQLNYTPADEEELDLGSPKETTSPENPQQKPETEKIVAQRLKEISEEKNRYKTEAELAKKNNQDTINKALEAFKALGFEGDIDDVVDSVIASDKGISKEELRKTKDNEKKLAEAESVLRQSEAKQLELQHLAAIKQKYPFVTVSSIQDLGEDYMLVMSGMYQKEVNGQKGAMDPIKAYEMSHADEVVKFKRSGAAQKAQSRELRSTGGGYATSSSLPARELAELERYNASCEDPQQRMSISEYKRRKGL